MAAKRDPEATRAAILTAAEEVFLDKGFADAPTSKIAAKAGVTKSLIHHHFGSKEKLWREVKTRRFSEYAQGQLEMLRQSAPDAELLSRSLDFYFRFLGDNPQLVRLMAWMYLESDEECSDMDMQVTQAGVEKLREGQESGDLRSDVEPHFLLFAFISLAQHWFQIRDHFCIHHLKMSDPTEELDRKYLQAIQKVFFEGVLPR